MKCIEFLVFFVVVILCAGFSFAQGDTLVPVIESQYFSIYGPKGFDISELLSKLNFKYFLRADMLSGSASQGPKDILVKTMDVLYLEVSDILGIHVYSFHGNIEFYPDQASVSEIFKNYSQEDFTERSFYLHGKNTIYISFSDLTLGMLGHEIAHAIQSHYFAVPPPPKVQEILSGYVEYSLQKTADPIPVIE